MCRRQTGILLLAFEVKRVQDKGNRGGGQLALQLNCPWCESAGGGYKSQQPLPAESIVRPTTKVTDLIQKE